MGVSTNFNDFFSVEIFKIIETVLNVISYYNKQWNTLFRAMKNFSCKNTR